MCLLRVYGRSLDSEALKSSTRLPLDGVLRRGDPVFRSRRRGAPKHQVTTVNVSVMRTSHRKKGSAWLELSVQVRAAERFLRRHARAIQRLRRRPDVDGMTLDFPIDLRIGRHQVAIQSDHFPSSLVQRAGRLGIGLELTIYG